MVKFISMYTYRICMIHGANTVTSLKMKAVIFDLDGTLTDTADIWLSALNQTLASTDVPKIERSVYIEKYWGMDGRTKLRLITGITSKKELEKLYDYLNKILLEKMKSTKLMPKVGETVAELKRVGMKLGVVSNSSMDVIQAQLHATGLSKYFDALIADAEPKPSPEGIERAHRMLHTPRDATMFVGDTNVDAQAGNNAKIKTVIVGRDIPDMGGLLGYASWLGRNDFFVHSD